MLFFFAIVFLHKTEKVCNQSLFVVTLYAKVVI